MPPRASHSRSAPRAATRPERRRRKRTGGVTLSEVAQLAGVAMITASRAINTPDQVSAATLARVREAIARTGYVPNLLAGGLASTRSRLVAALVPTIAGPVFQERCNRSPRRSRRRGIS